MPPHGAAISAACHADPTWCATIGPWFIGVFGVILLGFIVLIAINVWHR